MGPFFCLEKLWIDGEQSTLARLACTAKRFALGSLSQKGLLQKPGIARNTLPMVISYAYSYWYFIFKAPLVAYFRPVAACGVGLAASMCRLAIELLIIS